MSNEGHWSWDKVLSSLRLWPWLSSERAPPTWLLRFERLLGADISLLLEALKISLEEEKKTLWGKKDTRASKSDLKRLIRTITAQEVASSNGEGIYARLEELYTADQERAAAAAAKNVQADSEAETEAAGGEGGGDDDDADSEDGEAEEGDGGGTPGGLPSSKSWNWMKDLLEVLKKMGGVAKVTAERPSTAAFGNWGIIGAVQRLAEKKEEEELGVEASCRVTAHLFMGKRRSKATKLTAPLSRKDGDQVKEKQWAALREAFLGEGQVLIFHLKNHYAPVYALREWR
ncbi:unnamed protein product, partial [Chrysoparadoxa australica]